MPDDLSASSTVNPRTIIIDKRSVAISLALGMSYLWLANWLLVNFFFQLEAATIFPLAMALGKTNGWGHIWVQPYTTLTVAVERGIVFGLPLGFALRQNWLAYWLLFVASVIASTFVYSSLTKFGIEAFVSMVLHPVFSAGIAGTLLFTSIGQCLRVRYLGRTETEHSLNADAS
jgi:hypothetical protein